MKKAAPKSSKSRLAMVTIVTAIIALCLAGWYLYNRHARITGIRNVVLISIDTCRADHLSCYGYKRKTTPNIDKVAADGVLFNNAISPVPLTTPSHSSMFTGTYPPSHGVRLNNGDRLADSNVTLAETMRDAGYQTAAFVGSFPLDSCFGLNQGFGTYDCKFTMKSDRSSLVVERTAEEVSRPAMDWLDKHGKTPFFLFLHYYDPHLPYSPPQPYSADYANDRYAGEIAYVDSWIGQVLDRLRTLGIYDNTLVIITGDHGEGLGEHGEIAHGLLIYQSTLHVPLVIRTPRQGPGRRIDGNVSLVDIVPTVLDMLRLKIPAQVEGVSLASCLRSGKAIARSQPIYAESLEASTFECGELYGVIEGPWKHILAPRQELYDLSIDAGEQRNVIDQQSQVVQKLGSRLKAMLHVMASKTPKGNDSPVDPETIKRLESLGYLSGGATPTTSGSDPAREDPKDFLPIYERLQKAHGAFLANRSEEAAKELLAIVRERPRLVTAHAMLAEIAIRDRKLADAAMRAQMIVSILTATNRISQQKPPAASDLPGTRLDTQDPATAHFNLAVILHEMGKPDEASNQFAAALRLRPDYAEAHFKLGLILEQAGKQAEAIDHYEQALRSKPDYADAHMNLGNLVQMKGRLSEAIGHYEQALKSKRDYVDARFNLAMVLQRTGKLAEAIGHYEQCLQIKPDYARTNPRFVAALGAARGANDAIHRYEKELREKQNDPDAHNNLGNVLRQVGRVPEAIGHYEQVLLVRPDNAETHYNLAVALAQTGKLPEAIGHYEQAVRLKPDFLLALNNLAWIRATNEDSKLRDGAAAVRLVENACQITARKNPGLLDTLAAAYAEAGRFPEAVTAVEEAIVLANAAKQQSLVDELQGRLALYRAGKPYRELLRECLVPNNQ